MAELHPPMMAYGADELVIAVVDMSKGERVLQLFRENGAPIDLVCMARGTARTEMLDLLGIGETSKAIVACLANQMHTQQLLKTLGEVLKMRYPGRGIAFSIPITGIGTRWHKLLAQGDEEEGLCMNQAVQPDGFDVVAVIMERGYTNLVMDVARKTGARGGTVISARGIAENEVQRFFGIELQAEKEIVFLVVKSVEKQQIMTAIMQAVGMKTKSHGIVLSLPVSGAIGLAD